MRLDQFISQTTGLARKRAKISIKQKHCSVNGNIIKDHSFKVNPEDLIHFDEQKLDWPEEHYYMLNKPAGYCCSHIDDGASSALNLLPATHKKLHFAGRLDNDTTGLVLLSSDGNWCHRVTSPKQKAHKRKYKQYLVHAAEALSDESMKQLCSGVLLNGETSNTLPAMLTKLDGNVYKLSICEGKYHQVKRMFAAVGNKVTGLHRISIGNIDLGSALNPGEYRTLTAAEVDCFNE